MICICLCEYKKNYDLKFEKKMHLLPFIKDVDKTRKQECPEQINIPK